MVKKLMCYKECIILCCVIIFNLFVNMCKYGKEYDLSELSIFLISIPLAVIITKTGKVNKYCFILVIMVVASIWAISVPIYSPIDESAHFSYINYICDYGKLPIISDMIDSEQLRLVSDHNVSVSIMYEAVHPPIYYLLMALLCSPFTNVTIRFWICKVAGVVFLCGLASVLYRWIDFLVQKEVIKNKDVMLRFVLITCLMPGLLTRFLTISNESLATLLVTYVLYRFTKCLFEGINFKDVIGISVLVAICFLTKITVAFIVVLWILLLIYYKSYKQLLLSGGCIFFSIIPWFVYNWRLYGALTGNEQHLAFVRPLVNPTNAKVDVFSNLTTIFTDMIYPQEGMRTQFLDVLIDFFDITILLLLFFYGINICKNIIKYIFKNRLLFSYDTKEKIEILNIFYFLCILGNIIVLVIGTVSSSVLIIMGRYLYLSLIPLIYIGYSSIIKLDKKKIILSVYAVFICILCIYNVYGYNKIRLSQMSGYLCEREVLNVKEAVLVDITEENGNYVSMGNDPQIIINNIDVDSIVGIEMQMIAEHDGEFVLYYSDGEGFTEECTIQSSYVSNYEELRFVFPENINVTDIRIDPPTNYMFSIEQLAYVK